jgi:hypothetical protein
MWPLNDSHMNLQDIAEQKAEWGDGSIMLLSAAAHTSEVLELVPYPILREYRYGVATQRRISIVVIFVLAAQMQVW